MADGTHVEHDPLLLAYLAGVIDSDGYITINRSVRKGRLYHAAVVGIAGTRREPHDLAASLWGGNVGCYHPANRAHRPQFQWSRMGDAVERILEDLMPYLRIKAENALLALELQRHVQDGRSNDPFPWFSSDYDPIRVREGMRSEMVGMLNIRRRAGRLLDGIQHDGYPA